MKYKHMLILCPVLLIGCATDYSCGQFPKSGCQPVSEVYEKSNQGLYDYRHSLFDDKTDKKYSSEQKDNEKVRITIGQTYRSFNYITPDDPVLTKPVIMRILFTEWEDKEKDLNMGGYVYIKLRDSEWVLTK